MAEKRWIFIGNHPALDFLNTRLMSGGHLVDRLESWNDVLDWMVRAKLHPQARGAVWTPRGAENKGGLRLACELREAIRRVVECRRKHAPPEDRDLETINGCLACRASVPALTVVRGRYRVEERGVPQTAAQALEPIASAAAHLLCSAAPDRLRACGGPSCVLWFLDTSKNGRRRWCSMATCGNRVKAAAHYRRAR